MKILYLYSKIMPYQIPVIRELVSRYNAEVHVVYWDTKGNAPYVPPQMENTFIYRRSELDDAQLKALVEKIAPQIIYVCGWQDMGYLRAIKEPRRNGVPIITGFDEIWRGTFRQRIGAWVFPYYLMHNYTHAWVSGPRQYEFAKKLGFKDQRILYHLYSGDTELFDRAASFLKEKAANYPKTFLFVGRMVPAKAIDTLAKGFEIYRKKYRGDWNLIGIGNGPLKQLLVDQPGVETYDFLDQSRILELLKRVGAFVMPSRFDVSPLVVHEFASAGLPLILSECIGNRLLFLIEQFNGYRFKTDDAEDLAKTMHKLSSRSTTDLVEMGQNSIQLSAAHNARFVAASLMSVVDRCT